MITKCEFFLFIFLAKGSNWYEELMHFLFQSQSAMSAKYTEVFLLCFIIWNDKDIEFLLCSIYIGYYNLNLTSTEKDSNLSFKWPLMTFVWIFFRCPGCWNPSGMSAKRAEMKRSDSWPWFPEEMLWCRDLSYGKRNESKIWVRSI